jgi:outer membrane receptor protein involved in Fe transport
VDAVSLWLEFASSLSNVVAASFGPLALAGARSNVFRSDFMFGAKNNTGRAVLATMAIVAACPALTQATEEDTATDAAAADAGPSGSKSTDSTTSEIVISAQKLNEARAGIETQTGASTYTIDSAAIQAMPGGENTQLNQVILQAPDVAQDSFGQLHIRGEHNGLQYRLNGIVLPEGISVFSQTLNPKIVDSLSLVTGALPAEFGLRTAGIIDVTTKSGIFDPWASLSLYGGSHNEIYPSFFAGGSAGAFNYFVTGDFLRNNLGIESPYNAITPIHDETRQYHGFGYFEYILDPNDRVSWILGTSRDAFQIPNTPGLTPSLSLNVDGQTDFPSADLDERQTEITQFAIVSFQHVQGELALQTSLSARYTSLTFFPDAVGDVLYNGIAQNAFKKDVAYGWQTDGSYHLNDAHMLRFGFYFQHDRADSRTSSDVFYLVNGSQTDAYGNPTNIPSTIVDKGQQTQNIQSVYLQDEWKLPGNLTANYGVRFDNFSAYSSGHQVEPRVNLVWVPIEGTTVHGGYSRYFSPPPFELIGGESLNNFVGTTSAPLVNADTPPLPEKANYYDIGVQQKFLPELTVGLDSYYKQARDLIDEGQFGAPIVLTPFNYRYGQNYGVEFTVNYATGPLSIYFNTATQRTRGKALESAQFNFDPAAYEYTQNHWISVDHEQQYTSSAGLSYLWNDTRFSIDALLGSGLRKDLVAANPIVLADGTTTDHIPNGAHLPYYRQVNLGVSHTFRNLGIGSAKNAPTVRLDVINVFDTAYEIRNGTGIGVGAPQWGPRRGFFGGVTFPLY